VSKKYLLVCVNRAVNKIFGPVALSGLARLFEQWDLYNIVELFKLICLYLKKIF
jgi:hypothetical protein